MTKQTKAKITEAFWSGDWEAMRLLLKAEYDKKAEPLDDTLNQISLSRRTFYQVLSKDGNPSLKNIFKILSGIK